MNSKEKIKEEAELIWEKLDECDNAVLGELILIIMKKVGYDDVHGCICETHPGWPK